MNNDILKYLLVFGVFTFIYFLVSSTKAIKLLTSEKTKLGNEPGEKGFKLRGNSKGKGSSKSYSETEVMVALLAVITTTMIALLQLIRGSFPKYSSLIDLLLPIMPMISILIVYATLSNIRKVTYRRSRFAAYKDIQKKYDVLIKELENQIEHYEGRLKKSQESEEELNFAIEELKKLRIRKSRMYSKKIEELESVEFSTTSLKDINDF